MKEEKNWLQRLNNQSQIKRIDEKNKNTEKFGLTLSKKDIEVLLNDRRDILKYEERIEFGEEILSKLIQAFCDSPYIYQSNYVETLGRLQEIFYRYKNETMDKLSDDELINFMKKEFDGNCQGLEELISIVAQLTKKYTLNESSSIPYDIAKQLMGAVVYCIEEYQNFSKKELYKLVEERISLQEIYNRGYDLVLKKTKDTVNIYNKTSKFFCAFGNRCYRDTFTKDIPVFLKYYDVKFNPQDHIIFPSYPTLRSVEEKSGVDFMYEYINLINMEQMFLSRFPKDYIENILTLYNHDYKELIINISSIVLRHILTSMIMEEPTKIEHSKEAYEKLKKYLSENSIIEIENKLCHLIEQIIEHWYPNNYEIQKYLTEYVHELAFDCKNVAENNCLEQLLVKSYNV